MPGGTRGRRTVLYCTEGPFCTGPFCTEGERPRHPKQSEHLRYASRNLTHGTGRYWFKTVPMVKEAIRWQVGMRRSLHGAYASQHSFHSKLQISEATHLQHSLIVRAAFGFHSLMMRWIRIWVLEVDGTQPQLHRCSVELTSHLSGACLWS